jgi:hypothetical protein
MGIGNRLIAMLVAALLAIAGVVGTTAGASTTSTSVQLDVSPSRDLVPGQGVTVTASGLVPGDVVWPVEDCARYCERTRAPRQVVDATGRVTFVVTVERYLWDSLFGEWSDPPLDCAYVTSCAIRLAHDDDTQDEGYAFLTAQPIAFSRAQPSSPAVTIAAHQPLPSVVTTDALGHGFAAGGTVYAARCFTWSTPAGNGDRCEAKTRGVADESGSVTLGLELRRRSLDQDCLDPTTVCTVRMWGGPTIPPVAVTAPITFDPDNPPPPTPVITVMPSTDLGVAATVHVHGVGFRPDHPVGLEQCGVAPISTFPCALDVSFVSTGVTVQSRADGTFDAAMPVQRYLNGGLEAAFDCATAPGCQIVADEDPYNPSAPVPITFASSSTDPVLTFDTPVVTEGTSADPTVALAHVHLDRASTVPVRFRWAPESFTDLLGPTDVMEIAPGRTAGDFPIWIRADAMHEPDETAHFRITAMEGAQIDPATPVLSVRIRDDDPVPRISVDDVLVSEGDPLGQATVHLHLSNPTQYPVDVRYGTHDGTARDRRDYEAVRAVESLGRGSGDGSSDRYLHVPLVDDHRKEPLEYFDLVISRARNARIADGRARIWIVDDDHARSGCRAQCHVRRASAVTAPARREPAASTVSRR